MVRYVSLLDGTDKFGSGVPRTAEAAAVTCPNCDETVFANTIGEVTCDACDHEFYARDHRGESCSAVACDSCGEEITFIQENRTEIVDWETYYCYNCHEILAVETADGPQSLEQMLATDWVLNGQSPDEVGTGFGDEYWMKRTRTAREQFATDLLNTEARTANSSFNAYFPGDTDAHLCFTEEYCVGYITWNQDQERPELGQVYLLPEYRGQGIGSGFVETWRGEVAGADSEFLVNNPNPNMFRLLRSIGVIELTDDGPEFHDCDISGHWFDLPDEW